MQTFIAQTHFCFRAGKPVRAFVRKSRHLYVGLATAARNPGALPSYAALLSRKQSCLQGCAHPSGKLQAFAAGRALYRGADQGKTEDFFGKIGINLSILPKFTVFL